MSKELKEKIIKQLKNQTCRSCGYRSDYKSYYICLKGTKGYSVRNLDDFCYFWKQRVITKGMTTEEIFAREG